jgi:hypothetical protein
MKQTLRAAFVVACYLIVTLAGYVAFRGFPDQSARAWLQFSSFYVLSVVYPAIWRARHVRALKRLELENAPGLLRFVWAPVIVGGTAFLIVLNLLTRARG